MMTLPERYRQYRFLAAKFNDLSFSLDCRAVFTIVFPKKGCKLLRLVSSCHPNSSYLNEIDEKLLQSVTDKEIEVFLLRLYGEII